MIAPSSPPAVERWRRLVRARMAEMERLSPGRGVVGPAFWDSRARQFAARLSVDDAAKDPMVARLRRVAGRGRDRSFIDVGAGTGRLALNVAPRAARVIAVDPSERMLAWLRREARRRQIANVEVVTGRWEDADVAPADFAFSSYVLTIVPDPVPFVLKMDAAARRQAFLYLGAYSADAVVDPLWRHFHGAPRKPGPSYLDAVAMLRELGIDPSVEVVELPNRTRFNTVAEAVKDYRDYLALPDDKAVRQELAGLLTMWLVPRDGGLGSPLRYVPAAIVSWPGNTLGRGRG